MVGIARVWCLRAGSDDEVVNGPSTFIDSHWKQEIAKRGVAVRREV
jgi:hypothetical protein